MNRRDRPRIIANFAITADGKVSTRNLTPTGFTSKRDRRTLLAIRARGDAVMAGRNTVATDAMSMTLPGRSPQPLRVIISNRGNFDPAWKVFTKPGGDRILLSTQAMPRAIRRKLEPLARIHLDDAGAVDLPAALRRLRRDYAVRTLVCEGGPGLFRSLLEIDAIDELYLTIAPLIFGGAGAPTLTGTNPDFLRRIHRCALVSMEVIGGECYLHYRMNSPRP